MKFAVISDIHGNYRALQTVLADVGQYHVDRFVCLGDVATLGSQPKEVLNLLRTLPCDFVAGNHDHFLLNPASVHEYTSSAFVINSINECRDKLSPDDIDFIAQFMPIFTFTAKGGRRISFFHASPTSNTELLLPGMSDSDIAEKVDLNNAEVLVYGHTHLQLLRQIGNTVLLNPGSVGAAFKEFPQDEAPPTILPLIEYAVITFDKGLEEVIFRRIPIADVL